MPIVLYIVTTDSVTSLHPMYISRSYKWCDGDTRQDYRPIMSELPSAESCLSVDSAWPRGSADISSISRRNYDILLTLVWLIRLFTHWNLFPPVSGSIVRETTSVVVDWALNVSVRRVGLLHTPILHAIAVPLCSLHGAVRSQTWMHQQRKTPSIHMYNCMLALSVALTAGIQLVSTSRFTELTQTVSLDNLLQQAPLCRTYSTNLANSQLASR